MITRNGRVITGIIATGSRVITLFALVAGFSLRIFAMLCFGAASGAAFRLGIAQVVSIKIL
jgi:hypothetical protein